MSSGYVCTALIVSYCLRCIKGDLYVSAWASALLVLDEVGNARRLKVWDERQFSNPRFFCICAIPLLLLFAGTGWRQVAKECKDGKHFHGSNALFLPAEESE